MSAISFAASPKIRGIMPYAMDKSKGFECDREAKNDLTASTATYLKFHPSISFWERTEDGELVPYGDPRADSTAGYDLYMGYKGYLFAEEAKERSHGHMDNLVTASTEGEILEIKKKEDTQMLIKQGFVCYWIVLYGDGKIRIWNLNKLDLDKLPHRKIKCPVHSVDKVVKYVPKMCYLLPANKSIIIDRLNGN